MGRWASACGRGARPERGGRGAGGAGWGPARQRLAACCGDRAGLAPVALVPWPQERTELRGDTRAAPRPLGNHTSVHLAEQMLVLFLEFCLEKKKTTYEKKKKKPKTVNLHVVTLLINHFKNSPLALYFRNVRRGQSVSLWPRVLSRFWFSQ